MKLDGKVAIITGAGSGMGASAAELFIAEGAKVAIADIDLAAARAVAEQIGGDTLPLQVDVRSSDSARKMVDDTDAAFGGLDILVNNAGRGMIGSVVTTGETEWNDIVATNLNSVFLCSKHAIPAMIARGGGSIVNTASNVATIGKKDRAAYIAAKGAVAALTRAMALDHVDDKIRVNSVAPGAIWTSYFDKLMDSVPDPEAFKRSFVQHTPMGRFGTPREIANAILWLASDDSSFATGSMMTIDGGMTIW